MIRSRCEIYKNFISENSSDQKKLFFAAKKLLNHTDKVPYPPFNDKLKLANEMVSYFREDYQYPNKTRQHGFWIVCSSYIQ